VRLTSSSTASIVRPVVAASSPPGSVVADQRRPFVRELQRIELDLMRAVVNDPTWLSPPDEAAIRWALALARVTVVQVRPDEGTADVVDIGGASDGLRRGLHQMLAHCVDGDRVNRDGVRAQAGQIRALVRDERATLLRLFGNRLPASALDRATRRRPLALAMSGGGGTGYVYVGALAVLDEAGLQPALIAGTSMGALIGAFRARTKAFSLGNIRQLLARLSWRKVFRLFDTDSRFGLPATLKLGLREVIGHEFLIDDDAGLGGWDGDAPPQKRFLRMDELAIPMRVTIAGLVHGERELDPQRYARLLDGVDDASSLRRRAASLGRALQEITREPVRPVYVGGDELTRRFDVLDAVGFSSAVPGVIHYDILRDDRRMIELVSTLMRREGVARLVDGGLADNLPAREAWRAIQEGAVGDRDPFVLSLDAFAPQLTTRHLLFLPLMRIAAENSRTGREQSHLVVTFRDVLSPLAVVPGPADFLRAVENGRREMAPHVPLIRKMVGPIPDPPDVLAPTSTESLQAPRSS
jgi:predicted acylesterase/phospholipase RssA